MFTGIIRELGEVVRFDRGGDISRLSVRPSKVYGDARIGDSISVNGVCLSVTAKSDGILRFDILAETLKRSGLGGLKAGEKVNLEPSLEAGQKLGGHFLSGHIDCRARIMGRSSLGESIRMKFRIEKNRLRYIAQKGSVAVDGVSLTVAEAGYDWFSVYLIPLTLSETTLGLKGVGDEVNIEFDMLAKYVENFLGKKESHPRSRVDDAFLSKHGFM